MRVLLAIGLAVAAVAIVWQFISFPASSEEGKVVLITGASQGVGAELALSFARRNASIVIVARNMQKLQAVRQQCLSAGSPRVLAISKDLSSEDSWQDVVSTVDETFGKLDRLVLNHAYIPKRLVGESIGSQDAITTGLRELKYTIDTNLHGSASLVFGFLEMLQDNQGQIVVVSTAGVFANPPFYSSYVSSKAAVNSFFDVLRTELFLLKAKVDVTTIHLGEIATDQLLQDLNTAGASNAMNVHECADQMLVDIQAAVSESYVPRIIGWVIHFAKLPYLHQYTTGWYFETTRPELHQRIVDTRDSKFA